MKIIAPAKTAVPATFQASPGRAAELSRNGVAIRHPTKAMPWLIPLAISSLFDGGRLCAGSISFTPYPRWVGQILDTGVTGSEGYQIILFGSHRAPILQRCMVHRVSPSSCLDGLWQIMNPLDAIVGAGVGFEKPSARARCLHQPGKGISHNLFAVVVRPFEDYNPM